MRRWVRISRDAVTAVAFLVLLALIAARLDQGNEVRHAGAFTVTDGDTLSLDGQRYRLIGIDAPERHQTCGTAASTWPCGEASRQFLIALVAHGGVECTGRDRDRYNRLLVVCRSPDESLNARMVREGMAIAYGSKAVDYRAEEAEARAAKRGLWSGEFQRPQDWRRANAAMGDEEFHWLDRLIDWFRGLVENREE